MSVRNTWHFEVLTLLVFYAHPCFAARPSEWFASELEAGMEMDRTAVNRMEELYRKIEAEDTALAASVNARNSGEGHNEVDLAQKLKVGDRFLLRTEEDGWALVTLRSKSQGHLDVQFTDGATMQFGDSEARMQLPEELSLADMEDGDSFEVQATDGWERAQLRSSNPWKIVFLADNAEMVVTDPEEVPVRPLQVPLNGEDLLAQDNSPFAQALRKALKYHGQTQVADVIDRQLQDKFVKAKEAMSHYDDLQTRILEGLGNAEKASESLQVLVSDEHEPQLAKIEKVLMQQQQHREEDELGHLAESITSMSQLTREDMLERAARGEVLDPVYTAQCKGQQSLTQPILKVLRSDLCRLLWDIDVSKNVLVAMRDEARPTEQQPATTSKEPGGATSDGQDIVELVPDPQDQEGEDAPAIDININVSARQASASSRGVSKGLESFLQLSSEAHGHRRAWSHHQQQRRSVQVKAKKRRDLSQAKAYTANNLLEQVEEQFTQTHDKVDEAAKFGMNHNKERDKEEQAELSEEDDENNDNDDYDSGDYNDNDDSPDEGDDSVDEGVDDPKIQAKNPRARKLVRDVARKMIRADKVEKASLSKVSSKKHNQLTKRKLDTRADVGEEDEIDNDDDGDDEEEHDETIIQAKKKGGRPLTKRTTAEDKADKVGDLGKDSSTEHEQHVNGEGEKTNGRERDQDDDEDNDEEDQNASDDEDQKQSSHQPEDGKMFDDQIAKRVQDKKKLQAVVDTLVTAATTTTTTLSKHKSVHPSENHPKSHQSKYRPKKHQNNHSKNLDEDDMVEQEEIEDRGNLPLKAPADGPGPSDDGTLTSTVPADTIGPSETETVPLTAPADEPGPSETGTVPLTAPVDRPDGDEADLPLIPEPAQDPDDYSISVDPNQCAHLRDTLEAATCKVDAAQNIVGRLLQLLPAGKLDIIQEVKTAVPALRLLVNNTYSQHKGLEVLQNAMDKNFDDLILLTSNLELAKGQQGDFGAQESNVETDANGGNVKVIASAQDPGDQSDSADNGDVHDNPESYHGGRAHNSGQERTAGTSRTIALSSSSDKEDRDERYTGSENETGSEHEQEEDLESRYNDADDQSGAEDETGAEQEQDLSDLYKETS